MSRTIEAVMAHMPPAKRDATPAHSKRLTARRQNGLESGSHVQRKLRLIFTNEAAQQQA